jgi:hypothetical protein
MFQRRRIQRGGKDTQGSRAAEPEQVGHSITGPQFRQTGKGRVPFPAGPGRRPYQPLHVNGWMPTAVASGRWAPRLPAATRGQAALSCGPSLTSPVAQTGRSRARLCSRLVNPTPGREFHCRLLASCIPNSCAVLFRLTPSAFPKAYCTLYIKEDSVLYCSSSVF